MTNRGLTLSAAGLPRRMPNSGATTNRATLGQRLQRMRYWLPFLFPGRKETLQAEIHRCHLLRAFNVSDVMGAADGEDWGP